MLSKSLQKIISSAFLFYFFGLSIVPIHWNLLSSEVRAAEERDELYFLHTDHLGSTTVITDEDGNVVKQTRNFPYGADRINADGQGIYTERSYTGQIKDYSTNLHYYNARYYDPNLGTFTSADTEGERFSYAGGNPVINTDPTGHYYGNYGYSNPGTISGEDYRNPQYNSYDGPTIQNYERATSEPVDKLWSPNSIQMTLVDLENDQALARFVEKGVAHSYTPHVLNLQRQRREEEAQLALLGNASRYVYENMPKRSRTFYGYVKKFSQDPPNLLDHAKGNVATLSRTLKSEPEPLGESLNPLSGGKCWHHALAAAVILHQADPNLDVEVQTGQVLINHPKYSSTYLSPARGAGHAWLRANIGDSTYIADPTWQGAVLPHSEQWQFHKGFYNGWSAYYSSRSRSE